MEQIYSINDWRYFTLAHASKYDWSTGKNSSEYNHDYYEAHKAEILGKRGGSLRDFGGKGVGYKATSADKKSYEDMDDWSGELTQEELENIRRHNEQAAANISKLIETVENYIEANKGKLTKDQIDNLRSSMNTQIEIQREQMISTRNSDDRNYIMGARKSSGETSTRQPQQRQSAPSRSSGSNKSSNTQQKPQTQQQTKKEQEFKNASDLKRYDYEQMQKNSTNPTNSPDYENEARYRQHQQANTRVAGRSTQSTQNSVVVRQKTYSEDEERRRARRTGNGTGGGRVGYGSNRYGR